MLITKMRNAFKSNVCGYKRLYFLQGRCKRTILKIKTLQNAIINLYKRTFHAYTFIFASFTETALCYLTKMRFSYLLSQDAYIHEKKKREQYKDTLLSPYN